MKKEISLEEYRNALKIIRAYEEQQSNKKNMIYDGCTKEDIFTNKFKKPHYEALAFWVTKEKTIPERNPDAVINLEPDFYTIDGGRIPYKTFEEAREAVMKIFKRKKYII